MRSKMPLRAASRVPVDENMGERSGGSAGSQDGQCRTPDSRQRTEVIEPTGDSKRGMTAPVYHSCSTSKDLPNQRTPDTVGPHLQ